MNAVRGLSFTACLLGFILWSPSPARACSCAKPPGLKKAVATAAAVFLGKVTLIEPGKTNTESTVTFELRRAFKAVKGKSVRLSQESMCGFSFEQGKTYVVYATTNDEKKLTASICSRTALAKAAGHDLKSLRASVK